MKTLLLLGGAKRVSVSRHLIEAFARQGEEARVVSYELDRRVPLACVGEVIEGLRWNDPDIDADLLKVISDYRVDLVLPFVDPAVEICARLKCRTEAFIPVSNEAVCHCMFDKRLAYEAFASAGLPQPAADPPGFPRIYKPRCGSASKGIVIARSEAQVPHDIDLQQYLVQEYIEQAREFTVDSYIRSDGEVLSVVPRERLETAGGEAMRSITVADEALLSLSHRVLKAIPFRGPVTIQFLRDASGRYLLMEVNPRLGGGVVTSIGAGSRLPEMITAETLGHKPEPVTDWLPGTLMTRYTQEVIFPPCK